MVETSAAPLSQLPRRIAVRATASLLAIGALVLLGQLLIQEAIDRQAADSRVLNLAGRQRMLSQRLAKAALASELATDPDVREAHLAELEHSTDLLERVHVALQHGDRDLSLPGRNSRAVRDAFQALDPHLRALVAASRDLAATLHRRGRGPSLAGEANELARLLDAEPTFLRGMEQVMARILGEEPAYLARMDAIVTEYEGEASAHVASVKARQLAFVAATLTVLGFLGCGVLLPVIRQLRRTVEVREAHERARLSRTLLEASMRERERIGRDLHDGVGQILAAIGMMSRALAQRLAGLGMAEAADARRIEASAADAVAQARDLARALHPVDVANGIAVGLRALADYAELAFGVHCSVHCDAAIAVADDAAATHLYRIAQEAITNAVKHGRAQRIALALRSEGRSVRLSVLDDGVGIHRARHRGPGLGLENMRDRAGMLGGTLDVAPRAGGGTAVTARFRAGAAGMLAA